MKKSIKIDENKIIFLRILFEQQIFFNEYLKILKIF